MPLSDLMRNRFFPSQPSPQPYTDFAQQGSLMPYSGTGSGAGTGPFGTTPTIPSMGGSQGLWNPYAHLKPGDPHYGEQGDPDFQRGPWQMPPIQIPGGWRDQVPTGPINAGGWPGAQQPRVDPGMGRIYDDGRKPPADYWTTPIDWNDPASQWRGWTNADGSPVDPNNPHAGSQAPSMQGGWGMQPMPRSGGLSAGPTDPNYDPSQPVSMSQGGWGFGKGMR